MYAIQQDLPNTNTIYPIKNPFLNSMSFKKYLKINTPRSIEKLPIVLRTPINGFYTFLTFVL